MRSVADALREETRRQTAALTPEDRVRLALELGDADVVALSSARQISADEARSLIARSRRAGRQPSQAHGD
jgi:methylmalonyl-CoA mutase cobalamin-binding subunit